MHDKLAEISAALEALIQNQEAGLYASSQYALDESLVFGTRDAYLRLAEEIIEFVSAAERDEVETREVGGVQVQTNG